MSVQRARTRSFLTHLSSTARDRSCVYSPALHTDGTSSGWPRGLRRFAVTKLTELRAIWPHLQQFARRAFCWHCGLEDSPLQGTNDGLRANSEISFFGDESFAVRMVPGDRIAPRVYFDSACRWPHESSGHKWQRRGREEADVDRLPEENLTASSNSLCRFHLSGNGVYRAVGTTISNTVQF